MMNITGNNSLFQLPNCDWSNQTYHYSRRVEYVIYGILIPTIAIIGILGNILNLFVLTHRSWRNLGRLERFVHTGLVALACADMGVCLSVCPWGIILHFHNAEPPDGITFRLVYETYSPYFINTFMLASALLTTSLAIGRYLAIMWPLEMRARINGCFTRAIISGVIFASITMNLPRFWITYIEPCIYKESRRFQRGRGPLNSKNDMTPFMIYTCLYFAVAIAIPLIVLAFCNFFLLKHINKPPDEQISACYNTPSAVNLRKRQHDAGRLMTLVLAILVIMHIVLVTPSQFMYFLQRVAKLHEIRPYKVIVAIVNLLEIINFSFNFVLYCTLNVHFRSIIKSFFLRCYASCCCKSKNVNYDNCHEHVGYKMEPVTENTQLFHNGQK